MAHPGLLCVTPGVGGLGGKVEQAIDVSQPMGHLSFLLPATSPMIGGRLLGGENHIDVIKQT